MQIMQLLIVVGLAAIIVIEVWLILAIKEDIRRFKQKGEKSWSED